MLNKIFGTVNLLQKGIDAAQLRGEAIMNNIANAETPGFKATHIDFESALTASRTNFSISRTNERHIDPSIGFDFVPGAITDRSSYRMDENNFDVESEMAALAQNAILYNTLIEKLNSQFTRINMAISGQ